MAAVIAERITVEFTAIGWSPIEVLDPELNTDINFVTYRRTVCAPASVKVNQVNEAFGTALPRAASTMAPSEA